MSEQPFLVNSDVEDEGKDNDLQQIGNGGIRKNLLDEFADLAKTDSTISSNGREFMKVYLRIRPLTDEESESSENQDCMEADGDTAILLNAPKDSFTSKNEKRGREVTHRFTFSHVFRPETTQKQFFDNSSLDVVKDFMDGQNCLVFTYGVTNSGKTYTIQGTPKDGGILPRTLDVLFNSIQDKHYSRMNLKPRYFCEVMKIGDKQEHMEAALRNGLLMSLNKEHFDLNSFLQLEESNHDISKGSVGDESSLQASLKSQEGDVTDNDVIIPCEDDNDSRVTDDTSINVDTQGPVKFSVWISFAEIYNELIFDLLEPCPEGKGKKRMTLKLGDDKNGNPYIKGLREICVASADEAYKILRVGKKNQRIASTKLNQSSSRSHCIFSIKVLRVLDVDNPHVARVSKLSFVDLAGSERYAKTQNNGDRLKEAGNINTSLMTLGKCLDYLRYNQIHPNHTQIIPFRESKLTRLFQGFFCGKGKASMIVNINQCASTFDETYHALKFSAIAKQVTTKVSKPTDMAPPVEEKSFRASFAFPIPSKVPRMSIAWENGALATPAVGSQDYGNVEDEEDDKVASYIQQLENLVRHFQEQLIQEKRAKGTLELTIREEVCSEMAEQLVAIETAYSERIQEQVSAVEEKCDRRIELLAKSIKKTRKRARIERQEEVDEEAVQFQAEQGKVKDLTAQVKDLESNLDSMKTAIEEDDKRFKDQEDVMVELQSALETSSKELEIAKIKIDKRDRMLKEKDKIIEQLQTKLEEQRSDAQLKEENQEQVFELKKELEKELRKKNAKEMTRVVNELEEKVQVSERKLQEMNDIVKQSRENLKNLEEKLREKDEIIAEKSDVLGKKDSMINTLEHNLKQHQQALDDNESFLGQLNDEVKHLSSDLLDAKNKNQDNEEHQIDVKLETALARKISKLREQLVARDELMKELVQSLEQTRSQVELEKGDLMMICNEQKEKIVQLQLDLEVVKNMKSVLDSDDDVESLKEQLKKAVDESLNAKEEVETNSFEKEELKFALDAANAKVSQLEEELQSKAVKDGKLLKSLGDANSRKVSQLEKELKSKDVKDGELLKSIGEANSKVSQLEKERQSKAVVKDAELLKSLGEVNSKVSQLEEELQSKAEKDVKDGELLKSLGEANSKVSQLEKELQSKAVKDGELLKSLGEANSKVSQLEEELQSKAEKDVKDGELLKSLGESNSKVSQLEKELQSKAVKDGELLKSLGEANSKVSQLEEELQSKAEKDVKDGELLKSLGESNSKVSQLEKELQSKAVKDAELLKSLGEANSKVSQLEKELQSKAVKDGELLKSLGEANSKVSQLEKELQSKAVKYVELLKSLGEANSKVSSLEELLEKKDEEVKALQHEVNRLDSSMATLETANQTAKELFKKLEDEVSKQEKSLVELEKLKELKAGLDAENQRVGEEMQSKEQELKKVISEVEKLKQVLQTSEKVNEVLKNKLGAAEEKIVSLEEKKDNKHGNEEANEMEVDEISNKDVKKLEKQLKATTIALDKKNSQLISRNNTVKRLELSLQLEKETTVSELNGKSQGTPSYATPGRDLRTKEEIRTLRRRVMQADKENEEYKQKVQEYQKKIDELTKTAGEYRSELDKAQRELDEFEKRLSAIVKEREQAQDKTNAITEKLEANEKQVQLYRERQDEAKVKAVETAKELEKLNTEAENVKKELSEKILDLNEMRAKAEDYEKKVKAMKLLQSNEEKVKQELSEKILALNEIRAKAEDYEKKVEAVKLQQSGQLKDNDEKVASLLERTKNAEVNLTSNAEKLKSLQESKDQEVTQLQTLLQTKETQIEQKAEELASIKKQFSNTEKEKSDELDKVWNTLVELQQVIKERGEAIDILEDKLSKAEARHSREKNTLESTVAKMKEVMETKGGDRKKHRAQIAESEIKMASLNENNQMLITASERREKDVEELKKVLEQQDAVMEEQQAALSERQVEIESLVSENTYLQESSNAKESKSESTTADIRRLEGTLSVFKEEKEKLEKELSGMRKNGEDYQISKVEMSRDFEKEKCDMLVKLEKKEGNLSKLKAQLKNVQSEKKALEQKYKEMDERLKNSNAKQKEYESLCHADIMTANKERDGMLKAMQEAFAIASAKKEEYETKLEAVKEKCAKEIAKLKQQPKGEMTVKLTKIEDLTGQESSTPLELEDVKGNDENEKPSVPSSKKKERKQRGTNTRSRKTEVRRDENSAPPTSNDDESTNKECTTEEEVLCDITSVTDNSVKILKDEPIPDNRIEIDVTPIQRRKRASRAQGGSKSKPKKRRSSELPLSEIKTQLSAKRSKLVELSDDEFTPGSVIPTGTRRTRVSSTSSSCSTAKKQRPPVMPMTPMNEEKQKPIEPKKQPSMKKKRFLGKLFSISGGSGSEENTPPKRGVRKLLKKEISAPMELFSPCIATISTVQKSKARSIITRQLRSRAVKL